MAHDRDQNAGNDHAAPRKRHDPMNSIRIFLVDDHPVVLHGLRQMIEQRDGLSICGEATATTEAIRGIREQGPDVVVLDITLEDGNGLELIKQIHDLERDIRVIVISMHDEEVYAERAMRAGALGYVQKTQRLESLADGIQQVIRKRLYLSDSMKERVVRQAVSRDGQQPAERSPVEQLTDRELEVFELIGRGLSTQEAAERLHLSVKTIDTHREHIREKLGHRHRNDLIRHAVLWVERLVQ
jgi:DNA-binding NarL/FixJ family response regulator